MVARGIIAKAIRHLQEDPGIKRIDIGRCQARCRIF